MSATTAIRFSSRRMHPSLCKGNDGGGSMGRNRNVFSAGMKRRVFRRVGSLAVACLLILTGCGSSGTAAAPDPAANTSEAESGDLGAAAKSGSQSSDAFTIRQGVNLANDIYDLKVLDDHTGLFKDQGINLETTEFSAGINTIDAIATGQLDIGLCADYAGVNRIGNTQDSTDLRFFASFGVADSYSLYVNPEKIKSSEDLYDATLISQAGVVFEYEYAKLFEKEGVDGSRIELTNVGSIAEALALAKAGTGDAYWAALPFQSRFAAYGWVPYVNLQDVDAPMYTYLVANESYLKENKEEVSKFLKVAQEGIEYINDHLDESAEWISEASGIDKQIVIDSWKANQHDYNLSDDAVSALKNVKDWCYKNGKFDKDYEVTDFIDPEPLKAAFPEKVTY